MSRPTPPPAYTRRIQRLLTLINEIKTNPRQEPRLLCRALGVSRAMRFVRYLQHWLSGTGPRLPVIDFVPVMHPIRQWADTFPWEVPAPLPLDLASSLSHNQRR